MRRPSPAMLVALVALFIALGGPAQARRLIDGADIRKGSIRSAQIRDRSLATKDLSSAAVRALRTTPDGSIGAAQLAGGAITAGKLAPAAVGGVALADGAVAAVDIADSAVTPGKLADGAVTPGKLADGAVTGAKIADGTLTTADIARYSGAFRVLADDLGTIAPHQCWAREPRGLAPELAGADISQDALLVVPRSSYPERALSFTYRMATPVAGDPASTSRFVLALCNVTDSPFVAQASGIAFSYVIFDLP